MEEFRNIEGFNYQVSNIGNVLSLSYRRTGKPHPLTKCLDKDGYERVLLVNKKERKGFGVHTLVVKAFPEICGEWFEGCQIDHINTIKTDNRAVNLRVCSCKENANNPITLVNHRKASTGVKPSEETKLKISKSLTGRKLNEETKLNIKVGLRKSLGKAVTNGIKVFNSIGEAEEETGIYANNIVECCKGRRKTAGGYRWSYVE